MIQANITFYRSEKDKYVVFKLFNQYYIFVSLFEDNSSYSIASLISFNGSPLLKTTHIVFKDTLEEIHKIINKLRNLVDNKNSKELFYQK